MRADQSITSRQRTSGQSIFLLFFLLFPTLFYFFKLWNKRKQKKKGLGLIYTHGRWVDDVTSTYSTQLLSSFCIVQHQRCFCEWIRQTKERSADTATHCVRDDLAHFFLRVVASLRRRKKKCVLALSQTDRAQLWFIAHQLFFSFLFDYGRPIVLALSDFFYSELNSIRLSNRSIIILFVRKGKSSLPLKRRRQFNNF